MHGQTNRGGKTPGRVAWKIRTHKLLKQHCIYFRVNGPIGISFILIHTIGNIHYKRYLLRQWKRKIFCLWLTDVHPLGEKWTFQMHAVTGGPLN